MSWPADSRMAHRALLYRDEPEFRGTVGAFIREGLARRERILATAPLDRLDWIKAELGADAAAVEFADSASHLPPSGGGDPRPGRLAAPSRQ